MSAARIRAPDACHSEPVDAAELLQRPVEDRVQLIAPQGM